ncbi:hypothetical protein LTR78_001262 [Recurvomyces mirabilis]|uniref:NmrA-like domain-containing protein n=1 Tax=Recurvomyces mirabilis TaxID=574656 RepID=A0AAE1C5F3_9PEZI|nr:hypothetical protein LTR78_001262 [Recurvomyces mirabilis]KAK5161238.1 hypothetical protein LTS14_001034 [Recurvomyces mirabilis]
MVTVALAGATTGFGLTMLRVFHHLNSEGIKPYKLVLLSRSAQPEWSAKGIDVRPIDYANHSQLTTALGDVHTVLSVIGGDAEAIRNSQLALLAAAKEAGVKRFAPSEYAGTSNEGIDLYAGKAEVWSACQAVASKTGMEVTSFQCGLFMSIFATGTPKPPTPIGLREGAKTGEEEALAGLRPWSFVLNMKAGTADLPGHGTAPIVLTDMRDIATFVYHALSLPIWPEVLGMRGDVKSFREMIAIAERVQSRKILVQENTVAKMRAQAEEDPGKVFYNQVRIALTEKWAMVPDTLNQGFPELKPTTCEEFVEKWWRGVEIGEPSWGEDKSFM